MAGNGPLQALAMRLLLQRMLGGLTSPRREAPARPIREHEIEPQRTLKPYVPLFFRRPDGGLGGMPLEDPNYPITRNRGEIGAVIG